MTPYEKLHAWVMRKMIEFFEWRYRRAQRKRNDLV